jgi:anti-anti-sigma regulatory factor
MNRNDLPQEIYRRIYRLGKQKVEPRLIAATVKLPVRTVRSVLERLFTPGARNAIKMDAHDEHNDTLSVFVYTKSRYAVLDLTGTLSIDNCETFIQELEQLLQSQIKAVAVRLTDVPKIEMSAVQALLDMKEKFDYRGRYLGLLDPSPKIEADIVKFGIDEKIPIFGTESAFEDNAFKVGSRLDKSNR